MDRGVARGASGPCPQSSIEWIFNCKKAGFVGTWGLKYGPRCSGS